MTVDLSPDPPRTPDGLCPECDLTVAQAIAQYDPALSPDQMTALERRLSEVNAELQVELSNCRQVRDLAIGRLKAGGLEVQLAQRDQIEQGLRQEVIRLQADYDVARDEIMRLRGQIDNCQANAHYRAWQESQVELQQARALVEQVTENAARLLMNGCEQHSGATFDEWLKAGAAQCPLCTNAVVEAARAHANEETPVGHLRTAFRIFDQTRAPGENFRNG